MSESWHIPRASLAGSSTSGASSNSSSKSYSNPSTVTRQSRNHYLQQQQEGHSNLAYIIDENERIIMGEENKSSDKERANRKQKRLVDRSLHNHLNHQLQKNYNNNNNNYEISSTSSGKLSRKYNCNHNYNDQITNDDGDDEKDNGIKRGSRSSQGSTDSNSSTHSASSGSLLLTAANLERFAAIHKKQQKLNHPEDRQNYNANIQQHQQQKNITKISSTNNADNLMKNNDTVIEIDPNLHFVKTKDVDTVSIASSTHFTMVNGIGGPPRKIKEGLCSRGHQVTVLIISMSFFFLIGISAMVYLLEMRAREMPQ